KNCLTFPDVFISILYGTPGHDNTLRGSLASLPPIGPDALVGAHRHPERDFIVRPERGDDPVDFVPDVPPPMLDAGVELVVDVEQQARVPGALGADVVVQLD